ncbi:MAG: IS4 family transposase [Myxococcales bacterium]|jgi:hypothetical protein|nr:IS4 family transposase [Myxococcales bacterium]
MAESIRVEFEGAKFGDRRLAVRLVDLVERLEWSPALAFPKIFEDPSQLEALYRFLNNDKVSLRGVLGPHRQATVKRCRSGDVLILHDTTNFVFSTDRKNMGRTRTKGSNGFFMHTSLAVTPERDVHGVLAVETWTRQEPSKTDAGGKRPSTREVRKDPNRESLRWLRGVEASADVSGIHVMDREGDNYDLLAGMMAGQHRFIVRSCHDRTIAGERSLHEVLARKPVLLKREVHLGARAGRKIASKLPPRSERDAQLSVRAGEVTLMRPDPGTGPKTLPINLVMVTEPRPPVEEEPVEWFLLTSEPIDTVEQIEAIVDGYRTRWVIEEYFKALKSGCQVERRQLESYDAMLVALGMFVPIAVRLLNVRTQARLRPTEPSTLLTPTELRVLSFKTKRTLSTSSTNLEIEDALARLGGHQKSNGRPGWSTLGHALQKLMMLAEGWEARESAERCDQS